MKRLQTLALLCVALSVLVACNSQQKGNANKRDSVELSGAGATFPLPFYNIVFENFHNLTGDMVAYGGIGSGGGIRNLKDGIVDFAASDAVLNEKEKSEMAPTIQIPTCMGAVVLAYNIPGIDSLNLSGEIIANIYSGKITKWNDEKIQTLNPEIKLPASTIIPVYRSDGSGTTYIFTDYLSKISTEWNNNYGAGKSVNFPLGQAAKGNPGVAGVISQTSYSIGYIGSEYAFAQRIPYATIQNYNGEFIKPTAMSISAATNSITDEIPTSITDSHAKGAYPISCYTWIIIYKEQNYSKRSENQAKGTIELLQYILSDEAQNVTTEVHYAPLSKKVIELSKDRLNTATYNGTPIIK